MALLEVSSLCVFYGGIHALKGIGFTVPPGGIITLIGSNGAGKTTTLRALSGLVEVGGGKIIFQERENKNWPPHRIVRLGIALVPEGRHIFPNLTVEENLLMGSYAITDRTEEDRTLEKVYSLFPRLEERRGQKGGTLSGGEQQMLALGRGLMSRPVLFMLDEPSLGLAPKLVREVLGLIRSIHREGVTILLIEQNARAALGMADYGYVLQSGRIVLEGGGRELLINPLVQQAYLGGS